MFVDRESDMSLIIELLAYEDTVSDDQAATHYFNDLAQCNEVRFILFICCCRLLVSVYVCVCVLMGREAEVL